MAFSIGGIVASNEVRVRDESGRFIAALHEGAVEAAEAVAEEIAAVAMVTAPGPVSGTLMASIDARSEGVVAWATADAPWAEVQELGGVPHDIPNSFGRGHDFGFGSQFDRAFFHPGNPATHFLEEAGRTVSGYAIGIVAKFLPS
jgi:hypothetical protein